MPGSKALHELADDFFQTTMAASPFTASLFGAQGFDHLVPDLTEEAAGATAARLDQIGAGARALDETTLSEPDRVTRDVLLHEAQRVAEETRAPHIALSVSSILSPAL